MLRFFRYLKGYIHFCAEGGFSERFLNLCQINGVSLWQVENDGVKVSAFTSSNQLELLNEIAGKSGMEIIVDKEKGVRTLINQHKWRVGVLIGLCVIILFFSYMSKFIWEVEIVGGSGVNVESFTQELERYGIKKGVKKSSIDLVEVERRLKSDYDNFSWVNVNIFGSKLQVKIMLAEVPSGNLNHETPVNIVARKNGKVVLVSGYYGENVVKEGEYVAEGSLLISGISAYSDGSEHKFHAKGKVLAETQTLIKTEQALTFGNYIKNNESGYHICFFNFELPLGFKKSEKHFSESYIYLESKNGKLPIGIKREDSFGVIQSAVCITQKEGEMFSLLDYVKEKREQFNDADFKNIEFTIKGDTEKITLLSRVECIEDIAVEKMAEIEETGEKSEEN